MLQIMVYLTYRKEKGKLKMKTLTKGFIKLTQHRHYYLGWTILMSALLLKLLSFNTDSKWLISIVALVLLADLLSWIFDLANNGENSYFKKKGEKNV